ncbi:hypothetical protein Tco_1449867, partial [Tanacetum coccineum]
SGIMEIESDIENMTLNEYLEYKAKMERRLRRNVLSNINPTKYEGADFNSFHRDKSRAFDYLYYHEDIVIEKYYELPPLLPFEDVERLRRLLTPTVHTFPEPNLVVQPYMPLIPFPNEVKVVRQEEPDNDIDSIPTQVPDVNDDLIQPLILQTIHIIPPDDAYVVTDTELIFDELLEEFRDEILNIIVVDE